MNLKNIIILLSLLFAFAACSDDTDPSVVIPTSTIFDKLSADEIAIVDANWEEVVLSASWKAEKPDETMVKSQFALQIDIAGNDFKRPYILAQTDDLSTTVVGSVLNSLLTKTFKQEPNTLVEYEIRVVTVLIGKDGITVVRPETASASQVLKVTTLEQALTKPVVYIVGDALVGWGNEAAKIGADLQLFFSDDSDAKNEKYTYTGFFKGEGGLKFPTIAGDWDTAYGYKDGKIGMGLDNLPAPAADGIYTLSVDTKELTASFAPYTGNAVEQESVGIIGDAANGWGDADDIVMTKVAKFVWLATDVALKKDKGMKFRANGGWDTQWGGNGDADKQQFPFDTNGGENINILEDGTYFVAVNTLTGHHIIIPMADLPKK